MMDISRRSFLKGVAGAAVLAATGPAFAVVAQKAYPAAPPRVLNVLHFGAKGDGVTDDTRSIQAALREARRLGAPVHVPSGVYRISNAIGIQRADMLVWKESENGLERTT